MINPDRDLMYLINRLSMLNDSELMNLDYELAIEESGNNENIKKFLISIQNELNLNHYGIKGMRWGYRKDIRESNKRELARRKNSIFGTAKSFNVTLKDGSKVFINPVKPPSLGKKILRALFDSTPEMGERGDTNYTINDKNGKKIGELSLINKNKKSAYADWITVDESVRGNGIATSIIQKVIKEAKNAGYSRLEINALKKPRSLYERIGFVYDKTTSKNLIDKIAGFEFGCKRMYYDLENSMEHAILIYESTLYHHGIKGQKWGVRRFQNKSGTYTTAGKKRYSDSQQKRKMSSDTKKKLITGIATGALTAGTVVATAYAIKNPKTRAIINNIAHKSLNAIKTSAVNNAPKVKEYIKNAGKKTMKSIGQKTTQIGSAMVDAAMVSMGTIAISRLGKKLEAEAGDDQALKDLNKIIFDTASAGINSLTKDASNNSKVSNKGGNVGQEVSKIIGAPSKKSVDKSSSAYQNLFKDSKGNQRDSNTRSIIKSLVSGGYDINQIEQYLKQVDNGSIKHSYDTVHNEINFYRAVDYVDSLWQVIL